MKRLSGKVAAITGGASGIGEATTRLFVEEGAWVSFCDCDRERGANLEAEIKASGGDVLFVETHVEREAEAIAFLQRTVQQFGRIDILVNNAGIRLHQSILEASEESWDAILGVNLKGYAFCAKAAIPEMRRTGGGSIVNVSSVRAVVAVGNAVQYDTTKAGALALTRALALEYALDGIRVNAICPGPILTAYHERRAAALGMSQEEYRKGHTQSTMLKRAGTPREVATCILFMASDESSYVTGTCLFVDGGQTAM